MAATQYQIFCKYFNETVNKIVSNESPKEWVSAEEWYKCKIAYNVKTPSQSNALVTSQNSLNTTVQKGKTYRDLYDALKVKMTTEDPITKRKLLYSDLSTEEKIVYDLCSRYEEIIEMIGDDRCVLEYAMIRPLDQMTYNTSGSNSQQELAQNKKLAKKTDAEIYNVAFDQNRNDNPKYDMLFTYNGMIQTDEQIDLYKYKTTVKSAPQTTPGQVPVEAFKPYMKVNQTAPGSNVREVVETSPMCMYEKMERLKVSPWFYICTCNSLITAMNKARELVDMYGKEAVKIGKVVPLDQYIEIV